MVVAGRRECVQYTTTQKQSQISLSLSLSLTLSFSQLCCVVIKKKKSVCTYQNPTSLECSDAVSLFGQ